MLEDMMGKLQGMQGAMEATKERLANIKVQGSAGGDVVVVEIDGNRKVTNVVITGEIADFEKEELEDLFLTAVNRAIEQADNLNQIEMANSARGFFPGM